MKLKEYLAQQNVRPVDCGKVLITFKLAAWSTWVLLVPFCGKLQPLRRLSRMSGPQRLKAAFIRRYPNKYEQWEEHVLRGSEWFAKRPSVRWIPDTFGQKHADFGLSIAEATVLYKVLFPIWAPLEFMYIVRLYKKKWGVMDFVPTPQSIEEYTDSYQRASEIDVLSLSSDPSNGDRGDTKKGNHDDDDNNNNDNDDDDGNDKGSGPCTVNRNGGNVKGGNVSMISNSLSIKGQQNMRLIMHLCSSTLAPLLGLFMQQMRDHIQEKERMQWNRMLSCYRYGTSRLCHGSTRWSTVMLSSLLR